MCRATWLYWEPSISTCRTHRLPVLQSHSRVRLEGIQLGDTVNLLHGADLASIADASSLRPPPRAPLRQFAVEIDCSVESEWRPPSVTFHQNVTSLAEQLSMYRVERRLFDGPEFNIRPGSLLRNGEDRAEQQRRLGEALGVELVEGRSYLLAALRRIDGRADHEVTAEPTRRFFDRKWHLTAEWRAAKSQLRPGRRIHDGNQHDAIITATVAQQYLNCFYAFGTHFISAVECGDVLIQVIALRPESSVEASRYWRRMGDGHAVEGVAALTFAPFAEPFHAMETGRIVSLAGDPQLPASMARRIWSNPRGTGEPSLLGVFQSGREAAQRSLAGFRAVVPIGMELTSIARFMEFFRALNFERVFRGAMLQRWGSLVHLPLRRLPSVEKSIAAMPHDEALMGALDDRAPRCHRILHLRGRNSHRLPAPAPTLLTQFLDAEPACHQASVLRLPDEAFARGGIVCQTMAGALILENESGSERDAVVDGLRFTDAEPEPGADWPHVRVRGDMHTLDVRDLAEVLPSIRTALEATSAILSSTEVAGERRRADATSFVEWLANLLPANTGEPEIQRLRVIALYLSRIESRLSWLPMGRIFHGETSARMHDDFARISSAAIEADARLRDHTAQLWARARPAASHADAPLYMETVGPLERFRSLNRCVSDRFHALLEEAYRACLDAQGRATRTQRVSAAALAKALAELRMAFSGQEWGPESSLVLQAVAHASCPEQQLPRPGNNLLSRHREEPVNAALEFAAREARLRAHVAQLDAIDALCGVLADDPAALDTVERSLTGLGTLLAEEPPGDASALYKTLRVAGPHSGGGKLERPLNALTDAWAQFDAARRDLLVARSATCRMRMEMWYHCTLDNGEIPIEAGRVARHADGPAETARQVQLEYFRLLAILGLALRHQQAALRSAGLPLPVPPSGNLEPGALGHLMALQGALLANRLNLNLVVDRSYNRSVL